MRLEAGLVDVCHSRQRLCYYYVLTLQKNIEDYRDSNAYLSFGLAKLLYVFEYTNKHVP